MFFNCLWRCSVLALRSVCLAVFLTDDDCVGLEFSVSAPTAPMGTTSMAEREQDELSQRLARLRNEP